MEKFIIYKRVSTDSQAKSGHGLNAQQRDIEIYFANFADTPYTVLKEFTEIASGASSDRPLFDQAVQLARKTGATLIASKFSFDFTINSFSNQSLYTSSFDCS